MNIERIEKRVRKELRTKKLIKKNDKLLLVNDGSKAFYAGEHLLKNIIKGLPVKIDVKKSSSSSSKYDRVIIPWSLDDEAEDFLKVIFEKKKKTSFPKNTIKLLINLTDDEITQYAKIKKLKGKNKPRTRLKKMLDKLENRYLGYKFSLLNSIKSLSPD